MIRSALKRIPFAHAAVHALRRARSLVPRRARPAILMYHRIADTAFDPWGLAVEPALFEEQAQWLARHRTVLALADFAERHRSGTLPADAVAITFDDGYACSAEIAAPVLKRLGLPATIFLPVQHIETGAPFWWDELETLIFSHPGSSLRHQGKTIRIGAPSGEDDVWPPGAPPRTQRQSAFYGLWLELRTRPVAAIERSLAELREQVTALRGEDSKRLMTAAQVRRSARSGTLEFGSHAITHSSLPALPRAAKAKEIKGSIERCSALSGSVPRTFAYPYGDHDEESEKLVEEAGFACGCTTREVRVGAKSRPFALPRIAVGNWDSRRLAGLLGTR